jgi:CheY-like chemotaxis protein
MIRVLIADDDEGYLESLRELVERQPEVSVVAEARDGLSAIELADEVEIDAAVIDVHMPLVDGAHKQLTRSSNGIGSVSVPRGRIPPISYAAHAGRVLPYTRDPAAELAAQLGIGLYPTRP